MNTSPESHISETELVAQFQAGEERAIRYMYNQYASALYAVIYRIVPSDEHALTLLKDTFVKAWQSSQTYDSKKGPFYTWLLMIARGLAHEYKSSSGFRPEPQAQPQGSIKPSAGSEQINEPGTEKLDLRGMTERLRPEQKELLDLIYFFGYTPADASQKLRIPLGTIKNRVRSSVLELRKIFRI